MIKGCKYYTTLVTRYHVQCVHGNRNLGVMFDPTWLLFN